MGSKIAELCTPIIILWNVAHPNLSDLQDHVHPKGAYASLCCALCADPLKKAPKEVKRKIGSLFMR